METYVKFSDLPYMYKYELWQTLRDTELIEYNKFLEMIELRFNDNLPEIISFYGNSDDEYNSVVITEKFKFVEIKEFDSIYIGVLEKSEISQGYVRIPKMEYDRLLQIEHLYNLLNNDD